MHPELFRKQYDFELDQRNGLTAATNIPMVAITVVASAASVVLVDFRYSQDLLTLAFSAFAVSTLGVLAFSVYSVFRSFWNYTYKKLPRLADLSKHSADLYAWHLQNGSSPTEAKALADADFADYLSGKIAEAADWNGQNNIVRGNYLHRATAAVALGVALLLPAALLYAHNKVSAEDKIHQVRLVAPMPKVLKEQEMSSNQPTSGSNQPASAPAPAPAPAPASKPSGPPNLEFKGNSDLKKPIAGPVTQKK